MPRPIVLMHVEDNDDHADLLGDAARETSVIDRVIRFKSADAAAEYLFGTMPAPEGGKRVLPDLILLDMELPGMDGIEFLRRLRANAATRAVPVTVLSVTGNEDRIAAAYQAGANSYIIKPSDYDEFVITLAEMHTYWSVTAKLPKTDALVEAAV